MSGIELVYHFRTFMTTTLLTELIVLHGCESVIMRMYRHCMWTLKYFETYTLGYWRFGEYNHSYCTD